MKALADFCYRKRRYVLLGWIVGLVGLFAISRALAGEYRTEFEFPESDSARAIDLLKDRGVSERTGFQGQIVFRAEQGVNDPAVRQTMEVFFAAIAGVLEGEQIVSPYQPENAYQVTPDGKLAYAEVNLSDRSNEQYLEDGTKVRDLWKALPQSGIQVELGGDIFVEQEEF